MSVMICNCGNCKWRDENSICYNPSSAKYLTMRYACECPCVKWQAKTPENNIETTTTDDDLFTMIKDLQKCVLKLTERVQRLEDKVGKLEESVEVLDVREKPKQEKPYKWKLKVEDIDKITPDGRCKESGKRLIDMNKCPIMNWDDTGEICRPLHCEFFYKGIKQEKWIVHRTLRTKNKEVYINNYIKKHNQYSILYEKQYAKKFTEEEAISIRDELNKKRVGKRYLWVVSKSGE